MISKRHRKYEDLDSHQLRNIINLFKIYDHSGQKYECRVDAFRERSEAAQAVLAARGESV